MKSIDQLIKDLATDEALSAALAEAKSAEQQDAILADAGYAVTSEDIAEHAALSSQDISDDLLDAACGGDIIYVSSFALNTGRYNKIPGNTYLCLD